MTKIIKYIQNMTKDEKNIILTAIKEYGVGFYENCLEKIGCINVPIDNKTRLTRNIKYVKFLLNNLAEIPGISPEYEFPKGRKEKNETSFECAKREFEEETRLTFSMVPLDITYIETYQAQENYQKNILTYRTEYFVCNAECIKYPIKPLGNEIQSIHWLTLEEAKNMLCLRRYELLEKVENKIH